LARSPQATNRLDTVHPIADSSERPGDDEKKVTITLHHSRLFDPDSLVGCVKPVLDALRHWKLLVDDRPKWIDLEVFQEKSSRKDQYTTIVIDEAGIPPA
jgi:hypothetical protein